MEIASAGPWITDTEVRYVEDAARNGWYKNWNGYIDKFEKAFADYTESEYSISTSSCTGAIHIALRALGIGPGDEVIVPETTWIATVSSVSLLGATPVFVDVEADTWCMDPKAFEAAITKNTKAVIPVHMYGHPADMISIVKTAHKSGVFVLEDAAPGIGSKIDGKPTGSFGDAAVFSFQGAKPLVTGEGGILVTSNREFYEKCYYYWDHCREKGKVLFNSDIGYKYKMPNICAALGLAQLERADEIIGKRRQIFFWYQDALKDFEGIQLNVERDGFFNNFYVPTLILQESAKVTQQEMMDRLDSLKIGNRPFFRCLSKLPMYTAAETPVADLLAYRGINLPCSTMMTEAETYYVSGKVKEILKSGGN